MADEKSWSGRPGLGSPTGTVLRSPSVHAPQADSHSSARVMRAGGIGRVMDVFDFCTGTGVLACGAARLGAASDPQSTPHLLEAADLEPPVGDRVRIPFGPVMTKRPAWLREHGLVSELDTAEELWSSGRARSEAHARDARAASDHRPPRRGTRVASSTSSAIRRPSQDRFRAIPHAPRSRRCPSATPSKPRPTRSLMR